MFNTKCSVEYKENSILPIASGLPTGKRISMSKELTFHLHKLSCVSQITITLLVLYSTLLIIHRCSPDVEMGIFCCENLCILIK